jgi:hypothetical protein
VAGTRKVTRTFVGTGAKKVTGTGNSLTFWFKIIYQNALKETMHDIFRF